MENNLEHLQTIDEEVIAEAACIIPHLFLQQPLRKDLLMN